MRILIILFLIVGNVGITYSQLDSYVDCMDEGDAVIGLDRKDWAPISDLSEGYKLDFEIDNPTPDCARISGVSFTLSGPSVDLDNVNPPDCFLFFYTNIYVDCASNAPATCSGYWEMQGTFPTIFLNNDNDDFDEGTLLGYDIIVVHDGNIAACDQTPIANGDYSLSFEVCMEVAYELVGPEIDLGDDLEICENGTTTIPGPDDFDEYDWSGAASSSDQNFEEAPPGFYELIVTDDNGCTGSDDINVFGIDDFDLAINQPPVLTVCDLNNLPDLSALVNGNSNVQGYDYMWTFPDGSNSDRPTIAPDLDGTYTLEVIDRFSGCINQDQVIIEFGQVSPAQIDSISMESVSLCGGSATFEAFVPFTDNSNYTYQWVNGTDTTYGEFFTATDNGMYILNLLNDRNCPVTSDTIEVNQVIPSSAGQDNSDEVCSNDMIDLSSYLVGADTGGRWRDVSNTGALNNGMLNPSSLNGRFLFEYIIENNSPCDNDTSVMTMDMFVAPIVNIDDAICPDEFITINGNRYDINNLNGSEMVSGASPCDTLISINLQPLDSYASLRDEQLCENQSIVINGTTYDINNQVGTENMTANNGCDSIITVDLSFVSSIITILDDELCQGQTVIVNGNTYDETTPIGSETLQSVNGCDSIVNIDLIFVTSISTTRDDALCQGQSIIVNGTTYDETNPIGTETLQSINGCDSIVNVDLSFTNSFNVLRDDELCSGQSIIINGTTYDETNPTGTEMLQSLNGCDSTINVALSFVANIMTIRDDELCSGQSLIINGTTYDEANPSGTEMLPSANGCDSTINVALSFVSGFDILIDDQLCPDASVVINGNTYDQTNPTGMENLQSINGCDSTINVALSFYTSHALTETTATICQGDSVFVIDEFYSVAGLYNDNVPDQYGCDSLIQTEVIVTPCAIGLDVDFIDLLCNGDNSGIVEFSISAIDSDLYTYVIVGDNGYNEMGDIINNQLIELTDLAAGLYQVIIFDNNNDQVVFESFMLMEPDAVDVNLTIENQIDCFGETGDISSEVMGGTGSINYMWGDGESSEILIGVSSGSYSLVVTDQNNCTDEASITLDQPDELTFDFMVLNVPCGETETGAIEISNAAGGTMPYTFSIDGVNFGTDQNFLGLGQGTYLISILDANDCIETVNMNITAESSQTLDPIGPFTIFEGDNLAIDLALDFNPISIEWTPSSTLSCSDCPNPLASPLVTTSYTASVEDDMGCFVSTEVLVNVVPIEEQEPEIYIPTIFNPFQQDNNLFVPLTASSTDLLVDDFSIYDRWGNLVHQESGTLTGWDGTFNNKELGTGVYVYRISYTINGVTRQDAGSVTLIK